MCKLPVSSKKCELYLQSSSREDHLSSILQCTILHQGL